MPGGILPDCQSVRNRRLPGSGQRNVDRLSKGHQVDQNTENTGQEPDARPDVRGASRGKDDPRDADAAGSGQRAGASTEYAANGEPGGSAQEGYVPPADGQDTAANLDPHEPPGQG